MNKTIDKINRCADQMDSIAKDCDALRERLETKYLMPPVIDHSQSAEPNLCAYCNNPVPDGKFVHARWEERHDERE